MGAKTAAMATVESCPPGVHLSFKAVDDEEIMAKLEKMIEGLESDEDVTCVYHNIEESEEE